MTVKIRRICIPYGMDCNFNCKYCYRDECRRKIPKEPTPKFLQYLHNLTPDMTYAVIASGGEPLLYLDQIKKIFSTVPNYIHKKIMTNGSLLTEDIVDYINQNNIEVSLSHDGIHTKDMRGRDIFKDKRILSLCRNIKNLVITSVITNKNTDIMDVYYYEQEVLQRPFYFNPCVIQPTPVNKSLYENFDFDIFRRSYLNFLVSVIKKPISWYEGTSFYSRCNINVLLDGSVIGTKTMNLYGTVWDNRNDIIKKFREVEKDHLQYCIDKKCRYIEQCGKMVSDENNFSCAIDKIKQDCRQIINHGGLSRYVGD